MENLYCDDSLQLSILSTGAPELVNSNLFVGKRATVHI